MSMSDVHREILKVFRVGPTGPLPIVTGQRYGDRKLLPNLCHLLGYRTGAEIGVRSGSFSELFCKAGLEMWCIDPWEPCPNYSRRRQEKHLQEAVGRLSGYDVHFVKQTSMDALGSVPDNLDFIHIDGRHEFDFVMEDLIHWCPKVRPGGIIACHDYHLTGVKRAVEAYTLAHDIRPWYALKDRQPTAFWVQG